MRRILVLRGGALGDFVVTLPALALLRARWPGARIELAGNARAARCALGRHYLDAVHSQDEARWSRLGAGTLAPGDPFADWLREFDLIVQFQPDPDGAIAADFARLGFGPEDPPRLLRAEARPTTAPASAHFCEALLPLGLRAAHFAPVVFPSAEDRAAAAALLGDPRPETPLFAWHPGSGSPAKNWDPANWLEVFAALREERPHRLVVLLGEAEHGWWSASGPGARLPGDALVLRDTPPETLAAVAARCALFLGHDTGPSHLAAAAGCPCVLLFGPTDPAIWAPPHAHVRVVRRGASISSIRVPDVLAAIAPGPASKTR